MSLTTTFSPIDSEIKEKVIDKVLLDNTRTGDAPANDRQILPLRYWWITVAMVALFIGGISAWQRIFQGQVEIPPAVEYNIDRLLTQTEGLRVVALGDSYVRHAFPYDERLDKIALERGLSFKLTRFTKNYGRPKQLAVLLPHVLAAKPDIVFLEAGIFLLSSQGSATGFLAPFRKGVKNIKKKIRGQKPGQLFNENSEEGREHTRDWSTKLKMVEYRIKALMKNVILSAPKMPEAYEEFFKAAQAQGTQVVLLDLGHSKVVNEAFPHQFHDQITANLNKLEAQYPIAVWRFPSNFPLTHYKDIAHLNIRGQRIFIAWLLDQLIEEVKKID